MHSLDFLYRPLQAAWVFVLIVGATGAVQGDTLVEDFNDCNDDGWTREWHIIGNTVPEMHPAPGGTWDASFTHLDSCAYRLAAVEAPITAMMASWDTSSDPKYLNGFFRASVRPETQETGIVMGMRTDPVGGDAYLGEIHLHAGIMQIRDHKTGRIVQGNLDIDANEDWFMQIGTVGDRFSFKAWPMGDPEPPSPQLSATLSTSTGKLYALATGVPPGGPGGIGSTIFDDIHFFPAGDFDRNGELDVNDVNMLVSEIAAATHDPWLDHLTSDKLVDHDDLRIWVKDFKQTWFGDANLDGVFDSGDLVDVFVAGKYVVDPEMAETATWVEGDWNGDGFFDSGDLVLAFQDEGYVTGAAPEVPEPTSVIMLVTGLIGVAIRRRRFDV